MAKVSEFLDLLAEDASWQKRYDKNTDEAMDAFDLNPEQKEVIRYGTPRIVRDWIAKEEQLEDAVYILRMLPPI
jgi:hypothetical protein